MKSACPCCGAPVEAEFPLVDLNSNMLSWGKTTVRVRASEAEIMFALAEAHPRYATADHLVSRVWGAGDGGIRDAEGALRVHISALRKILQPFGFSIDVRYNKGWRLEKIGDVKDRNIGHQLNRRVALGAT